jgi:exodeoxyribonuclease VII large subunit
MLQILRRRFANLRVCVYPVRVQGDGAAEEITQGIEMLNRYPGIDVIIVARGGGSLEDLWVFNEEVVARAIYASKVPVISAVGHEVDYTIADFVADVRAPTPSAAAELVIRSKAELHSEIQGVAQRLERAMQHRLETWRARLEACQQRRVLKDPWAPLRTIEQRLDELNAHLARAIRARMRLAQEALERGEAAIAHLSPLMLVGFLHARLTALEQRLIAAQGGQVHHEREALELAVLARGYSICRHQADGGVIREAQAAAPGMHVDITLWQGSLQCTVNAVMTKGSGDARTDI